MSIIIKFFKDPTGDPEIINANTVGEWLISEYGSTGIPDELRVFKGHCSESNDISGDITALMETTGEYEICMMPGTPIQLVWALVVVVIALVVVIAMAKPISLNNRQQGSSTNALSSRSNQPRPNQRIVDIRGKVSGHMPDQLMVPYKVFESNIETEYSFLCVGAGEYEISDVKDGDTLIKDIDGSGAAFYKPANVPGIGTPYMSIGALPIGGLWNISRSNEIDGVTLEAPNSGLMPGVKLNVLPNRSVTAVIGDTGFNFTKVVSVGGTVKVTFTFLVFEGTYNVLIGGVPTSKSVYTAQIVTGTYTVLSVNIDSMSLNATDWPTNGVSWLGGVPGKKGDWSVLVTRPDTTTFTGVVIGVKPDSAISEMPDTAIDTSVNTGPSPYDVVAVIPENTNQVWINLLGLNGLYKEDKDKLIPVTIIVDIKLSETLGGILTGNSTPFIGTITGTGKDQVGVTVKMPMPYLEGIIKVTRRTPKDTAFSGNVVDEIKWRDFYRASPNTQTTFGNVTTVHTVRRATQSAMTSREAKFNVTAIRDGKYNMADVIYAMSVDPYFGRLTAESIDSESLYSTEQQIKIYFGNIDAVKIGYAFDDASVSFEDAISMLCDAVNVVAYRMGGVLKFRFERPQLESNMQFTHRSKWPGTDTKSRLFKSEKEYDGIELSYRDEYTAEDLTIFLPDSVSVINPKRIELNGCITNFGATIRARREYNKLVYSKVVHSFDSFGIARTLLPGMRIDVSDGTIGPFQDGEILDQSGLVVRLSQPVVFKAGINHSIVISRRDGAIEGIPVSQVDGDPYRVILSRPPSEDLFVGYMEAKTQYNFGTDEIISNSAMLVQTVEPNITNGEEKISVKCINYDSRFYSGDLQPV